MLSNLPLSSGHKKSTEFLDLTLKVLSGSKVPKLLCSYMVKVILHVIKYLPSSKTICNTSLASINCLLSCWAMFSLSMLVFKELSKNRKHIAKDCGLFPLSHNAMPNCLAEDYSNMEKLWVTLSLSSSTNTKNYSTIATAVSCMAVNCAEMSVYGSNNGSEAQKIELTRFCYFIYQW